MEPSKILKHKIERIVTACHSRLVNRLKPIFDTVPEDDEKEALWLINLASHEAFDEIEYEVLRFLTRAYEEPLEGSRPLSHNWTNPPKEELMHELDEENKFERLSSAFVPRKNGIVASIEQTDNEDRHKIPQQSYARHRSHKTVKEQSSIRENEETTAMAGRSDKDAFRHARSSFADIKTTSPRTHSTAFPDEVKSKRSNQQPVFSGLKRLGLCPDMDPTLRQHYRNTSAPLDADDDQRFPLPATQKAHMADSRNFTRTASKRSLASQKQLQDAVLPPGAIKFRQQPAARSQRIQRDRSLPRLQQRARDTYTQDKQKLEHETELSLSSKQLSLERFDQAMYGPDEIFDPLKFDFDRDLVPVKQLGNGELIFLPQEHDNTMDTEDDHNKRGNARTQNTIRFPKPTTIRAISKNNPFSDAANVTSKSTGQDNLVDLQVYATEDMEVYWDAVNRQKQNQRRKRSRTPSPPSISHKKARQPVLKKQERNVSRRSFPPLVSRRRAHRNVKSKLEKNGHHTSGIGKQATLRRSTRLAKQNASTT